MDFTTCYMAEAALWTELGKVPGNKAVIANVLGMDEGKPVF